MERKHFSVFFILVCKYTINLGLGLYDCLALMLPHPLTHLTQHVFCNFYFYFFLVRNLALVQNKGSNYFLSECYDPVALWSQSLFVFSSRLFHLFGVDSLLPF